MTGPLPRPSRRLNLSVQYACNKDGLPSREAVRRWARATLDAVDADRGGQVTVRFVDPDEGQELNRDYRGKDYATNVLSFPYDTEPVVMGDLIVCAAVVAREALEQGKPLEHHHAHLVVHGMLHLQGFDHEDDDDAEAMETLETEILAGLGYPDPYAAEKDSPAPRVQD
ncbi:rRNA maturation RNase YbeY [Oryzomicrobium sp.]|uniref:rRNA maturation RNase YbeY n=1 Tax=Oryzomicrobium sp. TaxID=1911578 RepID=UPI002FE14DE0